MSNNVTPPYHQNPEVEEILDLIEEDKEVQEIPVNVYMDHTLYFIAPV